MKEIACQDCPETFKAETRDEVLGALYDHYMEHHNEIITKASEEEKKAWMARFETEWAVAGEK